MSNQTRFSMIGSPEFINPEILDLNVGLAKCDIKVFYVGKNRNGSFISKDTAVDLAKTLRGSPIVGYYKDSKQDFRDHGEEILFDADGIHFKCQTRPFGFIGENAPIWFQKYMETDEFGNEIEREYLCTSGYLWAGQYKKECEPVLNEGRPQSMELDDDYIDGKWATDALSGVEYFIINDGAFKNLCILGKDIEPCFEGADVTAHSVQNTMFTKVDDDFRRVLAIMSKYCASMEGGQSMEIGETLNAEVQEGVETAVEETPSETFAQEETAVESTEIADDAATPTTEYEAETPAQETSESTETPVDATEYAALQQQIADFSKKVEDLNAQVAAMTEELNSLREFKAVKESAEKDALIAQFYMLDDKQKEDVIKNKDKYSLEEIESKLSVICFRNKISFVDKDEDGLDEETLTYSLGSEEQSDVPEWIKAVEQNINS